MPHDDITNAELFRSLTRIEVALDEAKRDHERRIRTLERMAYTSIGLATAGATSGIASLVASIMGA